MIARLRRAGWFLCIAALMGSAMLVGCEVAQEKKGCAVACGIIMVIAAAALVVKLSYG